MKKTDLQKRLKQLQDVKYRDMQVKIIPNIDPKSIIGVRTPELKALAKEIFRSGEYTGFLKDLPHKYFEENQLHAFVISEIKERKRYLS